MSNQLATKELLVGKCSVLSTSAGAIIWAYVVAIVAAELIGALVGPLPAVVCHVVLIALLVNHAVLTSAAYSRLVLALLLVPLLRVLSLTMPVREIPELYWYVLIGAPLLTAVALLTRYLRLSPAQLGLSLSSWRQQLWVAASGIPLCIATGLFGPTSSLPLGLDLANPLLSAAILVIFSAFAEELLFRGLLQQMACEFLGWWGVLLSSLIYMAMCVGTSSWLYVLLIGVISAYFGWCVARTRSIWGVVVAHSAINLGAFFISTTSGVSLRSGTPTRDELLVGTALWIFVGVTLGVCVIMLLRAAPIRAEE